MARHPDWILAIGLLVPIGCGEEAGADTAGGSTMPASASDGSNTGTTDVSQATGSGPTGSAASTSDEAADSSAAEGASTESGARSTSETGEPAECAFFVDDFVSGDTSWSDNGFRWLNSGFSVSDDFGRGDGAALRFTFGPDAPGEDSTSELRFELGRELQSLWIELYIYYPDGTEGLGSARYTHRDDESSDNNKFLRLWSGEYNSLPKVGASTRPVNRGADAGDSNLSNEYLPVGSTMGNFGSGGASWVTDGAAQTCQRGSWCQVRMEFQLAGIGEDNGVARWWVDGVLAYENDTLPNAAEFEAENFLDRGYLLGWANSGFSDLTHVYIDDVMFCDTPPGW